MKKFILGLISGLLLSGVVVATENKQIDVLFDNIKLVVNNKQIKMDTEAFIYNGRTYVPARFVAEPLGAKVSWNESDSTVIISTTEIDDPIIQNTPAPTTTTTQQPISEYKTNLTKLHNELIAALKQNDLDSRQAVYDFMVSKGYKDARLLMTDPLEKEKQKIKDEYSKKARELIDKFQQNAVALQQKYDIQNDQELPKILKQYDR